MIMFSLVAALFSAGAAESSPLTTECMELNGTIQAYFDASNWLLSPEFLSSTGVAFGGFEVASAIMRIEMDGHEPVSIVRNDRQRYGGTPYTEETLIDINRMGMAFVVPLLMKEINANGSLTLESPVADILGPDMPCCLRRDPAGADTTGSITLREIMTYETGICDLTLSPRVLTGAGWYQAANVDPPATPFYTNYAPAVGGTWYQFQSIGKPFFEQMDRSKIWDARAVLEALSTPWGDIQMPPDNQALCAGQGSQIDDALVEVAVEKIYGKNIERAVLEEFITPILGRAPEDTFWFYDPATGESRIPVGSAYIDRLAFRYTANPQVGTYTGSVNGAHGGMPAAAVDNPIVTAFATSQAAMMVAPAREVVSIWRAWMTTADPAWAPIRDLFVASVSDCGCVKNYQTMSNQLGIGAAGYFSAAAAYNATTGVSVLLAGNFMNDAPPPGSTSFSRWAREELDYSQVVACAESMPGTASTSNHVTVGSSAAGLSMASVWAACLAAALK